MSAISDLLFSNCEFMFSVLKFEVIKEGLSLVPGRKLCTTQEEDFEIPFHLWLRQKKIKPLSIIGTTKSEPYMKSYKF